MPKRATPIHFHKGEQAALLHVTKRHKSGHQLVIRARIVLAAGEGKSNVTIAQEVSASVETVRLWRDRWATGQDSDTSTIRKVEERLADAPRSGASAHSSAEQRCQMEVLACEAPSQSGRPISQWSGREIAEEMVRRGIVEHISRRHAARLLKKGGFQPHRFRYWLTEVPDGQREQKINEGCALYTSAAEAAKQGERTISMDEVTGVQALERLFPDLPMIAGHVLRREFEYIRHGTLSWFFNFDVVTGQVIEPSWGPTRNEADCLAHLQRLIASDPAAATWRILLDNLNTHQSESLVRWIAEMEGIAPETLGVKGKSGILQSMTTRAAFLHGPTHKVVFAYTPKHASWMNQIEIWLSILMRKLLKRGNFRSLADLQEQILAFVTYYNQTMAHPFKWTYQGLTTAV